MKVTSTPQSPPPPRAAFRYALPDSRLGLECCSLDEFFMRRRRDFYDFEDQLQAKEYTLVIVTHGNHRILLGQKHRGFGSGMWNSFGGKIEKNETVDDAAARELYEETGIEIPAHILQKNHCRVGSLYFTFQDSANEMIVRVYRIRIAFANEEPSSNPSSVDVILSDPSIIRGCEEITPHWIDDYHDIPLTNMFADDTIWLTTLLESPDPVKIEGHFHLHAGGQETNSLMYYHFQLQRQNYDNHIHNGWIDSQKRKNDPKHTLEQRLFHRLHDNQIHSPSIKEFNEAFAFVNKVRSVFHGEKDSPTTLDCVIDVAGGHGALAALFLITTSITRAIVIDPSDVGNGGVVKAWGQPYLDGKSFRFRHECLRSALPDELQKQLKNSSPNRILVVACHACQHLSEEILQIACRHGVHVAVMPCCQKDTSPGMSWKSTSKNLNIPIETMMDLLLAGKCMSWNIHGEGNTNAVPYDVRMKTIDPSFTPQNRIIIGRACHASTPSSFSTTTNPKHKIIEKAHYKMNRAYSRAHQQQSLPSSQTKSRMIIQVPISSFSLWSFSSGIAIGFLVAMTFWRR